MPSTAAQIRQRYGDGKLLNDGAPLNTARDAPANAADTVVNADTELHLVETDGDNEVDLSAVAESGRVVTVVNDSAAADDGNVTFATADFVDGTPSNMNDPGDVVTIVYIDGANTGWVIVSE